MLLVLVATICAGVALGNPCGDNVPPSLGAFCGETGKFEKDVGYPKGGSAGECIHTANMSMRSSSVTVCTTVFELDSHCDWIRFKHMSVANVADQCSF